jgi:hypothetical protein
MSGFLAQNKRRSGRIGETLERLALVPPAAGVGQGAESPLAHGFGPVHRFELENLGLQVGRQEQEVE